jgi:RimK family alpha-L-glutamate ligase
MARHQRPDLFLAAGRLTETNAALISALRALDLDAEWLHPKEIDGRLRCGDSVLARFDVRPTLDGVERGVWELRHAQRAGARVLNGADALLTSHDKLATAIALGRCGVPRPRTAHVDGPRQILPFPPPVVVKPRFGSWGRDVFLCDSEAEYRRCLEKVEDRSWFRRHGALVEELIEPQGYDLRVIVAMGRVVGAVERRAAPGEWRTNVALGAVRISALPDKRAVELALRAVSAVRADLVGVDLLPLPHGDYVVLEVNGAVDFTDDYSICGRNVFEETMRVIAARTDPRAVESSRPLGARSAVVAEPDALSG